MKVTVWTLVKSGSHEEPIVTAHTTKDDARRMLEHALAHEEITHVGDDHLPLTEAPLSDLRQAWEIHFDGHCRIEQHEVNIPLPELDRVIADLKDIVNTAKMKEAA